MSKFGRDFGIRIFGDFRILSQLGLQMWSILITVQREERKTKYTSPKLLRIERTHKPTTWPFLPYLTGKVRQLSYSIENQVQPVTGKGSQENDVIPTNACIECDFLLSELLSGGSYHFDE